MTGIEELASMDSDADPDGWSVGPCQMLLVRFGQIDHMIIDRAYLRCLSHDQGQDRIFIFIFKHHLSHIHLSDKYYNN